MQKLQDKKNQKGTFECLTFFFSPNISILKLLLIIIYINVIFSLRAKFGKNAFYNGLHCSKTFEDAKKEIGFFFSNGTYNNIYIYIYILLLLLLLLLLY